MPCVESIILSDVSEQTECLEKLFSGLAGLIPDDKIDELREAVYLREDTASNYIGDGLAVPHGRISGLDDEYVVVGLSGGIDWPTEDSRAQVVILVAVDRKRIAAYLSLLQKIVKWRKSVPDLRQLSPDDVRRSLQSVLNP